LSPIFIFGTGRCGSTHLQRVITLCTQCWVWGEHEGFLEPLLEAVIRYETGNRLNRFVFNREPREQALLIADMAAGSEMLSWLNRLDRGQFRAEIVSLIDRLFGAGVPEGWTDWGFKEIRYGLDNNAPEILLNMFPGASGVFTFREPRATIESMVRAWSPGLMREAPNTEKLADLYRSYRLRWTTVMKYFLDRSFGGRLVFVSDDKLARPTEELLGALGLTPARALPAALGITNRGPRKIPEWISSKLDELFAEEAALCSDLYARACAQSDADFLKCPGRSTTDHPAND
jgi:hypothetical protein